MNTQKVQRKDPKDIRRTASDLLSRGQAVGLTVLILVVVAGLIAWPQQALIVLIALALCFYLLFVGLKLLMHIASHQGSAKTTAMVAVDDPNLPTYTLLVPLYKEANMLPSLVASIQQLQYPKQLLQVLLLLEESDEETRAEAIGMDLPDYFQTVLVPAGIKPRGKPKALNMGLAQATGTFTVIYDAEDRPDSDQLLKVVAAFRAAPEDVACVQARLFFWNEDTSIVTRFYWTEYVVHYEYVLPGLAWLGLVPPLGGTSNHFRTDVLRTIAFDADQLPKGAEGIGGWDPWNVTEDAELAGALATYGYDVVMIDSVTYEEATAHLRIADKQRRRWLKGYLQTGLAYTSYPLQHIRRMGFARWFCYCLLTIGTPLSQILNPIFWTLTIVYFITRSTFIESLFPGPMFVIGALLMVVGNLLFFYQLIGACLHRTGYGSVRYMFLTPLWWVFTSWSAYWVLWELARPSTRSEWHKTPHGHDLEKEGALETKSSMVQSSTNV